MATLTVLNSGTAYSRSNNDIVAELAKTHLDTSAEISMVNSDKARGHGSWLINAGPGGGKVGVDMPGSIEPITGEKKFLKEKHLFKKDRDDSQDLFDFEQFQDYERNLKKQKWAQAVGKGMDHNVIRTLAIIDQWVSLSQFQPEFIDRELTEKTGKKVLKPAPAGWSKPPAITKVNLVGWSRGAVTCHMIANALAKYEHQNKAVEQAVKKLPVAIFAFDPVPGGSPGGAPYQDLDRMQVPKNVTAYTGIYSAHDTRHWFQPAVVSRPNSTQIIMPGGHGTAVQGSGTLDEASKIARALCHRFLLAEGTTLINSSGVTDVQIIDLYAAMVPKMDAYKNCTGGWLSAGGRQNRDFTKLDEGKVKPVFPGAMTGRVGSQNPTAKYDFFVNAHHEQLFKRELPQIYPKLFGTYLEQDDLVDFQKRALKLKCPNTFKVLTLGGWI